MNFVLCRALREMIHQLEAGLVAVKSGILAFITFAWNMFVSTGCALASSERALYCLATHFTRVPGMLTSLDSEIQCIFGFGCSG